MTAVFTCLDCAETFIAANTKPRIWICRGCQTRRQRRRDRDRRAREAAR